MAKCFKCGRDTTMSCRVKIKTVDHVKPVCKHCRYLSMYSKGEGKPQTGWPVFWVMKGA